MRLVLAMVLAGLVALPLSVSAQAAEEDSLSSWQEPGAAPEEPALQLKLDEAGIQVIESPPPIVDGYPRRIQTTDEPRSRGAKAGIAVGVILGAFIVGSTIAAAVALPF
jgi:hypothetical protein